MASSWHEVLGPFFSHFFLFLEELVNKNRRVRVEELIVSALGLWLVYRQNNATSRIPQLHSLLDVIIQKRGELHLSYWIAMKGYCWHSPGQGNKNQQRVARKTAWQQTGRLHFQFFGADPQKTAQNVQQQKFCWLNMFVSFFSLHCCENRWLTTTKFGGVLFGPW